MSCEIHNDKENYCTACCTCFHCLQEEQAESEDTITSLTTRIAELEAEVERLRSLQCYSDYQIRPHFIALMDREIKANAHKGDFDSFNSLTICVESWLSEHVEKLYAALDKKDTTGVSEFCADIANIAMKIEEYYGIAAVGSGND